MPWCQLWLRLTTPVASASVQPVPPHWASSAYTVAAATASAITYPRSTAAVKRLAPMPGRGSVGKEYSMLAVGPGTGPWTQPRGPNCRGGWTRNWASSVARGQARRRRRRGEHEAMSSDRAVWGRGSGPGPSFLRVSRWGTVWYWPFLCATWHVPAPPVTRELFAGDLPGLRCHQSDSALTGQAPLTY